MSRSSVFPMQIMGNGMPSARAAFNLFAAALTCLLPMYFMQEVSTISLSQCTPGNAYLSADRASHSIPGWLSHLAAAAPECQQPQFWLSAHCRTKTSTF